MYPVLGKLLGQLIYSYPLFIGISWGISYYFSQFLFKKVGRTLRGFSYVYWGTFLISWVGAKIFFLLFSAKSILLYKHVSFWTGGGFVFYGGLAFGLLYLFLISVIFKKFDSRSLVLFLPPLALSHAVGRLGCFLAGCCFGKVSEVPWAIHMHGDFRHPAQLYESLGLFLLSFILYKNLISNASSTKMINIYFVCYSLIRFLVEFFRGDIVRGQYFNFSTSQIISVIILMLITIINIIKKKNNYAV